MRTDSPNERVFQRKEGFDRGSGMADGRNAQFKKTQNIRVEKNSNRETDK